jgi:hypothetical protein
MEGESKVKAAQTSFDGTVHSGISHGLADPWQHIGDLVPGPDQELLDSTSRKTSVVETQVSSSSSVAVHSSNFRDTWEGKTKTHHVWIVGINSHISKWI